ncbi:MAG TPA: hypothetical protein VEM15_04255 [Thermodesulfobacteriota bacterium]|nr:hypothetical protein [Thermodesulfobacteriota bacterium]
MKAFFIVSLMFLLLACAATREEMERHPFLSEEGPDKVTVAPTGIVTTVGRIALVRNGSEYCAIKFTGAWKGEKEGDYYSDYESYYQGDGTGDFDNRNVKIINEQLIRRHVIGFFSLSFPASRQNLDIKCGPTRLAWGFGSSIHFFATGQPQGDHGIELAPTKWTDISQVNAFDSRLKWYRYDAKRRRDIFPIDRLWEDGNAK